MRKLQTLFSQTITICIVTGREDDTVSSLSLLCYINVYAHDNYTSVTIIFTIISIDLIIYYNDNICILDIHTII